MSQVGKWQQGQKITQPGIALPGTNSSPLKIGRAPKGKVLFQAPIFRFELVVSGRESFWNQFLVEFWGKKDVKLNVWVMLWVQNWGASLFWCAGQGQSLWEKNISWSHLYIAKLQDQWSLMSFCFPSFHIPGHLSKSVNSSSKKITPTQPFTTAWIGYFPFSLPRERSWLKCLRRSFEKRWLRCRCDLMLPAVTEENGGKTKV